MIAAPPQLWPVEQGDKSARLLTRSSPDGGPDATLEGCLLMTLRFVAGMASNLVAEYEPIGLSRP